MFKKEADREANADARRALKLILLCPRWIYMGWQLHRHYISTLRSHPGRPFCFGPAADPDIGRVDMERRNGVRMKSRV